MFKGIRLSQHGGVGWIRNVACFYNNLLRGVVENAVFAIDLQTFCALHTTICLVVRYTIIMII